MTYFAADDVPVFLLALISKGQRADLSQAERNELSSILSGLVQGRRRPDTAARAYLTAIKRNPQAVREALRPLVA